MQKVDLENIDKVKAALKLPENVELAFSGVLIDVWHWQQELFDGTTKTFEVVSRLPTSVAIILSKSGNILLQNETQPGGREKLTAAGGRAESYLEPWGETIKRELLEEISISATKFEKLGEFLKTSGKYKWPVSIVLVTEYDVVEYKNPESWGEKIVPKEVSVDEFFDWAKDWKFAADPLFCEFITRNEELIREKFNK